MQLPHDNDPEDPWTFFGEFSNEEIDGARRLLTDAGIQFAVNEGVVEQDSQWSGLFALWVRDENAAQASAIVVPYFALREKGITYSV